MAHFTQQINPVAGPLLVALVGVSQARADALTAAGQAIPQAQLITALVDTGASGTCVDPTVLKALGLTPTGSISVSTPSTGATPHQADQYDVAIAIPGPGSNPRFHHLPTLAVMCSELLASTGFHALIGRDILKDCLLVYNGPTASFTLAF